MKNRVELSMKNNRADSDRFSTSIVEFHFYSSGKLKNPARLNRAVSYDSFENEVHTGNDLP